MIETHLNPQANEAQRIAHEARADAFASLLRSFPRMISAIRNQR